MAHAHRGYDLLARLERRVQRHGATLRLSSLQSDPDPILLDLEYVLVLVDQIRGGRAGEIELSSSEEEEEEEEEGEEEGEEGEEGGERG